MKPNQGSTEGSEPQSKGSDNNDMTGGDGRSPSDSPFNPWRVAAGNELMQLVAQACKDVEAYEERHATRKRKRKVKDQKTFDDTVSALLCDVIHHQLSGSDAGIYISRSNSKLGTKDRYRAPALNKKLPSILDILASAELGYLRQTKGDDYRGSTARRTVIRAGDLTLNQIADVGISIADIGESRYQEPIVLKKEKESRLDKGTYLQYKDTDQTTQYRQEINVINDRLEASELLIDREALGPSSPNYNMHKRWVRRVFTRGRFRSGGRLFGGFWQDMSKQERRQSLKIDGEQAAELDFGQMAARILYGIAKAQPEPKDAYVIPDLGGVNREGVKKVFSAMQFRQGPLDRLPMGTRQFFPRRYKAIDVDRAIRKAHPAIADLLGTEIGHYGQFLESQIMVGILLALKDESVTGLPVHDAVLVPASRADRATEVMLLIFRQHTGVEGSVSREY